MKLPSLSQEILKSKSLVFSYSISMVADRLLPSRNSRQVQVTCFSCFYLHKAFVADRQIDLQLSSAFVLCLRKSIAWPTMRVSGKLGIFVTLYPYPYPCTRMCSYKPVHLLCPLLRLYFSFSHCPSPSHRISSQDSQIPFSFS